MEESWLEETVTALSAHGLIEGEAKLLSGDESFLGFTSFIGLL